MTIVPIYNSKGEADAFLEYPYLFNPLGEWIGFVTAKRRVYSVLGAYVGYLSNEPRILRKRATSTLTPHAEVPPVPGKFVPPATVPLAPLMPELTHSIIDVLLEEPERLHTADLGELRKDID
jgi:hypothetical protein